ncbi:Tetratricopeptide repeat protein [Clostridium sp. C105KSO15]|nr:Tetratricopeptide repeat protein [Clostridium sp. C105KSO15]
MEAVKIWEESIVIPTYEVGEADKNPMFLESRVYQGSSGKIYPYPTIEKIHDTRTEKAYQAVWLENEYLKVMILPELGGRIQRAFDKTNQYDFVYYNHVIKPALVGLCGPWISGGIEFNWPQHHRPTTYSPVDYMLIEHEDGSKTCRICDVDQMYGTKGEASFTLYPGKAYIEIKGQLYNPTPMPQTFLWWANPAVPVNDYTQSIFPPDVHAVMDHGKRDVSRFPIATGVYYKHDYSEGIDISRYKNIPVPTSYMAEKSEFNFVGGYDYQVGAGILHVADHHISPGKKQWTWGCGDFGKAWDRNLTDEGGPYIELMTGVYTDNQPDFTWLKPMEEKTFTQYFMPYKTVGPVKNASIHAVINLETKENEIRIVAYGTQEYPGARILLTYGKETLLDEITLLSPVHTYEKTLHTGVEDETRLTLKVLSGERELVSYTPLKKEVPKLPSPAKAADEPEKIMTNEELYLTGLHIEQYRHATYRPDPYYIEGLKRDPEDIRINNAYGSLLMRRGCFEEAEEHFRKALKRAVWKNPNPYDSEPYYNLGLVLLYQRRIEEAFDAFYKATWSGEQQEMSFYYLSCIESMRGNYESALELVEKGLVRNSHNVKARALKVYLLRRLDRTEEAGALIVENLKVDSFDYISRLESAYLEPGRQEEIRLEISRLARGFHENYLMAARHYAEFGAYEAAAQTLDQCSGKWPMLYYYKAYYLKLMGKDGSDALKEALKQAEGCSTDYCFPNKLEDISVLKFAAERNTEGANANYYLGNLYYDKLQYRTALSYWEQSARLNPRFPTVWRNLSLAYYNKEKDRVRAREAMEKAYGLNPDDARIFLELDQLYKKLDMPAAERLEKYEAARDVFMKRDDLMIEYATLLNLMGRYGEAYEFIMSYKFHPWEGGEGKVTAQYVVSLVELARQAMAEKEWGAAEEYLTKALKYPENLGEGKLEGTKDNHINYYLGVIMENQGKTEDARAYFETAGVGTDEPAGMMYYNDQPADMIYYQGLAKEKLGKPVEARARFYKLLDYGEQHMFDPMKIEYFAVSLPDFLIYEEDLDKKNKAHCNYLIGLGKMGLGDMEGAKKALEETIRLDHAHLNAIRYINMI